MPKVSRKDTGDATHTRERGDAKQTRASVATPDESARADLPRRLHKVRVDGGPERPPRPSSPDSPLCFEPREDPHVDALARALCALVKEEGKAYEGLDQAVRERLSMIREGKPTPPMNDAADELSRKGANAAEWTPPMTVHGVTAETAEDARPPPPRTINAVPGHTTRADEPELLKPDGSLAVPKRYNFLINAFAPATYGVAIRENEHVDVLRVRGADNVRGAVRYFELNDVDLVAFPPHFYVALGFDPVLAQAVPESSATPWGGHLAVRKGLLPFFVYFDLHPGSTLCGPNSRFWDAVRIYASLLACANFERAIARRPPIDMCDSLFCLHNVDPAAAGRRVTVDGDGAEWTVPCVRGGRTTKEKWRRLQEEAENGTISDEDAEELTYLLACGHLGGQMTREKWRQLLADEEAGTIGMKDRDYLAYLRECAARGGRTTKEKWRRLQEEAENGTISDEDAEELTYLRACGHLGGQMTREKWRRLQEEAENGTISDEDAEELTYLLACGHLGGQMTREKWRRLQEEAENGTISDEDAEELTYLRACAARGGATTGAEYKPLSEADTLTEPDRAKLERQRDARSRGGKAKAAEYKRLSEADTLTEPDRAKLERQRAQNVARGKKGGKANAAEYKRLSEADTLTEPDRAKLERQRDARSRGGKKGGKAKAAEDKRLSEADTLTEPDRAKLERLERQRAQNVAHGKKSAEKRWGAVTTLNDELEAILTENRGRWMTLKEVYDRMEERGFVNLTAFKNFRDSKCVRKYKEKSKSSLIWEHRTGTPHRPTVFRLSDNATTAGAGQTCIDLCDSDSE
ncbi:uncharacterized protein MICPUCDRAFT_46956 [Micromonas pusilla CCMP1545]|uniref:Predicted protein n=1 Tax=Micromonas pusilla (strain CCMP1545) TaxID=564608 RepID=C1MPT0_MICPC|nr:uncharacterized protein MICPUCDRAFT_46956 [Micromonas pusilla CCMP1545]EEH57955.1 predicted protein [Micromonas pusilla CCMP1545]|eukprot:XP_003058004.1 predicted protein [Micromonas pusilla CCMP1545]